MVETDNGTSCCASLRRLEVTYTTALAACGSTSKAFVASLAIAGAEVIVNKLEMEIAKDAMEMELENLALYICFLSKYKKMPLVVQSASKD
jgi:hypothetical protein